MSEKPPESENKKAGFVSVLKRILYGRAAYLAYLEARIQKLELQVRTIHELQMKTIDFMHERDKLREGENLEIVKYVQTIATRTGETLYAHKKDIDQLIMLTVGKPTQTLIDMKATGVWSPRDLGLKKDD